MNGADGSTVGTGEALRVQFQWTDGSKVYPETTFAPGDYYIYNDATYTGTNELLGYLRLYLGKNARSEIGYVFDYATALTNAPTQTLTVSCNLALIYQPFL